jgi:hypothetical protein
VPLGRHLAGPEPTHALEERILLLRGAPASNLHHDPPLVLALHHIGVLEVLEGGARGDGGGTVAEELVGVARELGGGAVSVSSIINVSAVLSR